MSAVFTSLLLVMLGCADYGGKTASTPFSMEELTSRTFSFFWETADTVYYQIPDRYPTQPFSSIAATGFGLSSYLVGIEKGYVSRQEGADRVLATLEALWALPQGADSAEVSGYRGFFYHFLTMDEATRFKNVELSTIDTGLLMAGILSCQSFFDRESDSESRIRNLADSLFQRVEWNWAMQKDGYMSMGWRPEKGFIPAKWQGYNEAMVLILMAMGSPSHPIPDSSWAKWCETYQWIDFYEPHLNFTPLFGHQYSHMFVDFRGIQDEYMRNKGSDYFENSQIATLANQDYCIRNPQGFNGYSNRQWGLTACDGPGDGEQVELKGDTIDFHGYMARGASGRRIRDDGTLAPTAVGGSIPFLPDSCIQSLEFMWNTYYDNLVGEYGFKDAFNLTYPGGWFDHEYLGIDQGPILIMAENHRSELIWNIMKKNPYIIAGLEKAGFSGGWLNRMEKS